MIKILDCTLRDGGYVNDWNFGENNIQKIKKSLIDSNIDIIECGFIEDKSYNYNSSYSRYNSFDMIDKKDDKLYALMLLTEKYNINDLPNSTSDDEIIRLSFHKKDIEKAIKYSKIIKEKGYILYWQPTATLRYNDEELKELINICNNIVKPQSIAIVDTFGEMNTSDILRLSNLFNEFVNKNIVLSFHSHNNLQNAYSNAVEFIKIMTEFKRDIVVDSSIFGMGRGAGNLCTELITDYLNKNYDKNYNINPLLNITDDVLSIIRKDNYWGYSLEYYLSAINSCHPNYSIYLSTKKTLTTSDISNILKMISFDKKIEFDKEYTEGLYKSYNEKEIDDEKNYNKLNEKIKNKKVLLVGPGKSIVENEETIKKYLDNKNEFYSISINNRLLFKTDAIFISNRKRNNELIKEEDEEYIFTSNIESKNDDNNIVFDYEKNIANEIKVSDNSLLMILNILKKINVKEIYLAGFDGFELNDNNFYDSSLTYIIDKNKINELNQTISEYIKLYSEDLNIKFITKSKYEVK